MFSSVLLHKKDERRKGRKGVHLFHRHHPKNEQPASPTAPPSRENTCSTCGTSNHQACKCLIKGKFSSIGAEYEEGEEIEVVQAREEQDEDEVAAAEESEPPSLMCFPSFDALSTSNEKNVNGIVVESHADHYSNVDNLKILQEGGVLFSFSCPHPPNNFEQAMLNGIANLSSFQDEASENHVPIYTPKDDYTFVISTCSYLLPGVDIDKLCHPEFLSSQAYHEACQPSGTVVWESDPHRQTTFRITKPVIPYIINLTVQFKVSKLEKKDIDKLSGLFGTSIDCGLLMERTKRNPKRQDSTKKAKSVLLYTKVECGVLVHHVTVIMQSSLPFIIAMGIHKFGAWGLNEACETVNKTREYARESIPMQNDDGGFGE